MQSSVYLHWIWKRIDQALYIWYCLAMSSVDSVPFTLLCTLGMGAVGFEAFMTLDLAVFGLVISVPLIPTVGGSGFEPEVEVLTESRGKCCA